VASRGLPYLDPPQPVPFHSDSALVHELDEAGWAKVLDAGPTLLAIEMRQIGGVFATTAANGGALEHFSEQLHYYGVRPSGVTGIRRAIQIHSK